MSIYQLRRQTRYIVIHCSETKPSMDDVDVNWIRRLHTGKGWIDVGYHYVIKRDGTIEVGRPDDTVGAGVRGHNHDSIHICLVGGLAENGKSGKGPWETNFTAEQWVALWQQIAALKITYPDAEVVGHRDLDARFCPTFDARRWAQEIDRVVPFVGTPMDSPMLDAAARRGLFVYPTV